MSHRRVRSQPWGFAMLARFVRDESGATMLEYGLIVAIVGAAIIGGLGEVGQKMAANYQTLADAMKERTP